jgi:uncharacterized membrane protein
MMHWLVAYGAAAVGYIVPDAIWLGYAVPKHYKPAVGAMLADKFNAPAALAFYVIYIVGVVVLAVRPALIDHSLTTAAVLGGTLGFVAYATYDLTNLATLRIWPVKLAVLGLVWGTLATGLSASAAYWAVTALGMG